MVEINIQATIGTCTEYLNKESADPAEISIVIAPLKVTSDDSTSKIQVVSGCNMWQSCFNANCWYSLAARIKKKAQVGK